MKSTNIIFYLLTFCCYNNKNQWWNESPLRTFNCCFYVIINKL